MKIKVMSYNIQSGRSNEEISVRDFSNALGVIADSDPDIIGLQELGKHPTAGMPEYIMEGEPTEYFAKELNMNGYFAQAVIFYERFPYGNALLSKYPIKSARTVMIPDPVEKEENGYYETRCILVAELDVKGGLTVLVSHFGLVRGEKENAVSTVIELIKEIKTPIIFMGDLNMTPDDEILKPLFTALKDTANGKSEPATWPSNDDKNVSKYEAIAKNIKERSQAKRKIDYIFTSEDIKVEHVKVIQTRMSDHMPYIAELDI